MEEVGRRKEEEKNVTVFFFFDSDDSLEFSDEEHQEHLQGGGGGGSGSGGKVVVVTEIESTSGGGGGSSEAILPKLHVAEQQQQQQHHLKDFLGGDEDLQDFGEDFDSEDDEKNEKAARTLQGLGVCPLLSPSPSTSFQKLISLSFSFMCVHRRGCLTLEARMVMAAPAAVE